MTEQRDHLQNILTIENWREELSREKRYREATIKRTEEKRLQQEREKTEQRHKRSHS